MSPTTRTAAEVLEDVGAENGANGEKASPYRQTPADALRKIGLLGQAIPLEPLRTFNEISEGGLRSGEALVIGGAAGVGKTALGVQYVKASMKLHRPTSALFTDQSPAAAAVRLGQLVNLCRERLEDPKGHPDEANLLERFLEELEVPVFFPAVDEEGVNVEGAAADLRLVADGREGTLIVDSLNMTTATSANGQDEERGRIKAVALAIARERKRYDLAVVATCELNRTMGPLAVYGPGLLDLELRVDLLNTLAESRAIGHAFDRVLIMVGDPERLVRCFMVKNRRGPKGSWWQRLDLTRSEWAEVPAGEAEEEVRLDAEATKAGKAARSIPAVIDFLKRCRLEGKGAQTKRAIAAGTGKTWREVDPAVDVLLEKKEIYIDDTVKRRGGGTFYGIFTR